MASIILGKGVYFLYGYSIYKILLRTPDKIIALDVISDSQRTFEIEIFIRLQQLEKIHFFKLKLKRKEFLKL